MPHPLSLRGCNSCNIAYYWLFHFLFNKIGGLFFCSPAYLSYHHHCLCFLVFCKHLKDINKVCPIYRVSAYTNTGGLPKTEPCQLVNSLIGQCPAPRYNTDFTCLLHCIKYRDAINICSPLAGCNSANHLCAVCNHLLCMKCPLLPCNPLTYNLSIFINEYAHESSTFLISKIVPFFEGQCI